MKRGNLTSQYDETDCVMWSELESGNKKSVVRYLAPFYNDRRDFSTITISGPGGFSPLIYPVVGWGFSDQFSPDDRYEEAMENYFSQYEDSSIFGDVDSSVFRHRFIIYLDDISQMAQTQRSLYSVYGVAKVNAHLEISRGFVMARNIVSAVSLVLVIILVIVSVFIMANTIKLTTFGRREEISIMKMVGANNAFIRFPFVVEGLILGLVGAGLAFLAQWGIYALVTEKVMTGIIGSFVTVVPFAALMYPVLLVYIGVGVLVGAFGGIIAIRNYLKV